MLKNNLLSLVNNKIENGVDERFKKVMVIDAINEGLRLISLKTNLYSDYDAITIIRNEVSYSIPSRIKKVISYVMNGKTLPVGTLIEMDRSNPAWRDQEGYSGTVSKVIRRDDRNIIIYPKDKKIKGLLVLFGKVLPKEVKLEGNEEIDINDLYIDTLVYIVCATLLMQVGRTEDINKASIFEAKFAQGIKEILSDNNVVSSITKTRLNGPFVGASNV